MSTVTIKTHEQISEAARESKHDDYLNDRQYSTRKRASYLHKDHRGRTLRTDRPHNGGYHYFGPGWMLPSVLATVTASIVWGMCGKMADMPEY